MAAKDPSFAPQGVSPQDLRAERASFNGTLLAALAYGALMMLYLQLIQVLLNKPKRGRTFYATVVYSGVLFPLATLAIAGMFKFEELSFIDNRDFPGGPSAFSRVYISDVFNVLSQSCNTLFPWFADLLMLHRILVLWNYQWWTLVLPLVTYLAKLATSIPVLISIMKPNNATWASRSSAYATVYYSLVVAFNVIVTTVIWIRLCTMRSKVEAIVGRLGATHYTSCPTRFVESGAFFTIWSIIYLTLRTRDSFVKDIFLYPSTHILGITRILLILRIAQDQAWSKDVVTASARGVMDWQVSSTHSVPLGDMENMTSMFSVDKAGLQQHKYFPGAI